MRIAIAALLPVAFCGDDPGFFAQVACDADPSLPDGRYSNLPDDTGDPELARVEKGRASVYVNAAEGREVLRDRKKGEITVSWSGIADGEGTGLDSPGACTVEETVVYVPVEITLSDWPGRGDYFARGCGCEGLTSRDPEMECWVRPGACELRFSGRRDGWRYRAGPVPFEAEPGQRVKIDVDLGEPRPYSDEEIADLRRRIDEYADEPPAYRTFMESTVGDLGAYLQAELDHAERVRAAAQ